MSTARLSNDRKIHVVSLKLDKAKPRELAFRVFLDQNDSNGINRKETILRMFETVIMQKENYFISDYGNTPNIDDERDKDSEDDKETTKMNTVNINESNSDIEIDAWNDI